MTLMYHCPHCARVFSVRIQYAHDIFRVQDLYESQFRGEFPSHDRWLCNDCGKQRDCALMLRQAALQHSRNEAAS